MKTRDQVIASGLALVVIIAGLVFVQNRLDTDEATVGPIPERVEKDVEINVQQAVQEPVEVEVNSGDAVTMIITSSQDDSVHLHGYDLEESVQANTPKEISFVADIDGVFELESHNTHSLLAEITVLP